MKISPSMIAALVFALAGTLTSARSQSTNVSPKPMAASSGSTIPTALTPIISGASAGRLPLWGVTAHTFRGFERNSDNSFKYPTSPKQNISMLRAVGADLLRIDPPWAETETRRGSYDFSAFDDLFNGAAAVGTRPFLLVTGGNPLHTAAWNKLPSSQSQYDAFRNWSLAIVGRYLKANPFVEIVNEPNHPNEADMSPAQYAGLLNTVAPALKAAYPKIKIVTGGLAVLKWGGLTPEEWLGAVAALLSPAALDAIDGWSMHPYLDARHGTLPENPYWQDRFVSAIKATGRPKPYYNTEQGTSLKWNPLNKPDESGKNVYDAALQIDYVIRNRLMGIVWGHAVDISYDLVDDGTDPSNTEHAFGLFDHGFRAKPNVDKLRAVNALLKQAITYDVGRSGDLRVITLHTAAGVRRIAWTGGATVSYVPSAGAPAVTLTESMGAVLF